MWNRKVAQRSRNALLALVSQQEGLTGSKEVGLIVSYKLCNRTNCILSSEHNFIPPPPLLFTVVDRWALPLLKTTKGLEGDFPSCIGISARRNGAILLHAADKSSQRHPLYRIPFTTYVEINKLVSILACPIPKKAHRGYRYKVRRL